MLTFEKILRVFDDILQQDTLYEVVPTSHGYTLLAWEPNRKEWYSAEILETPETMLDALLKVHANFLEDAITQSERDDLTPEERAEIESKCRLLREKCQAV